MIFWRPPILIETSASNTWRVEYVVHSVVGEVRWRLQQPRTWQVTYTTVHRLRRKASFSILLALTSIYIAHTYVRTLVPSLSQCAKCLRARNWGGNTRQDLPWCMTNSIVCCLVMVICIKTLKPPFRNIFFQTTPMSNIEDIAKCYVKCQSRYIVRTLI